MNEQYLEQFTNENLRGRFLNKENLEALEGILADETSRLVELERIKIKLNFGRSFKSQEIHDLFPRIRQDVDKLLEVNGIREPSLSSFHLLEGSHRDILRWYLAGSGSLAGGAAIGLAGRSWKSHVAKEGRTPSLLTRRVHFCHGKDILPAPAGANHN